jgi:hypothetical protein
MTSRKQKGLVERIYLLNAKYQTNENNENEWNLSVKASSKTIYKIIISENKVKCECMDFQVRKNVCKHMYFILGKILKETNIIDDVDEIYDIKNNFEVITIQLKQILNNHISNPNNQNNNFTYDNKDKCVICFEEFGNERVEQCQTICKNVFHAECINLWLSNNNSCPLCRTSWDKFDDSDDNNTNSLKNFKGLRIK